MNEEQTLDYVATHFPLAMAELRKLPTLMRMDAAEAAVLGGAEEGNG